MIMWQKFYQFRFGFEVTPVSFGAWVGWVGVLILWKESDSLEGLPILDESKGPYHNHLPVMVHTESCPACRPEASAGEEKK